MRSATFGVCPILCPYGFDRLIGIKDPWGLDSYVLCAGAFLLGGKETWSWAWQLAARCGADSNFLSW